MEAVGTDKCGLKIANLTRGNLTVGWAPKPWREHEKQICSLSLDLVPGPICLVRSNEDAAFVCAGACLNTLRLFPLLTEFHSTWYVNKDHVLQQMPRFAYCKNHWHAVFGRQPVLSMDEDGT